MVFLLVVKVRIMQLFISRIGVVLTHTLPIRRSFYRDSGERQKILESEVQYLLKHGLVKQSSSSWASPCLLVKKSDSAHTVTKADLFPLPCMEDCVDQFVSKFHLLKGYRQVPLTERARKVFITPKGLYSLNKMSFGLQNAPATFQRLMKQVVAHSVVKST